MYDSEQYMLEILRHYEHLLTFTIININTLNKENYKILTSHIGQQRATPP